MSKILKVISVGKQTVVHPCNGNMTGGWWMDGWMDGWMDEQTVVHPCNGNTTGGWWMDGWIDGWMNRMKRTLDWVHNKNITYFTDHDRQVERLHAEMATFWIYWVKENISSEFLKKHYITLKTWILTAFYKFPTLSGIASKSTLLASFYPGALPLQIINFNFETVQVTWNATEYSGANWTFFYK